MIHARDGLSFSNENSAFGDALASLLGRRPDHVHVSAIDHVNLSVRNLERSIEFYQLVFGFRLAEDGRERQPPYVILAAGRRAFLALHESEEPDTSNGVSINHWGFSVGDLNQVVQKLAKLDDATIEAHPRADARGIVEWQRSRSLYVQDPDGHQIELVENFGGGLGAG